MTLFAMRRANGDWFALNDRGDFRVPIFKSARDAATARHRETGMECFRAVALDEVALKNLTTTEQGKACYWLIEDPSINLKHGLPLDRKALEEIVRQNGALLATTRT